MRRSGAVAAVAVAALALLAGCSAGAAAPPADDGIDLGQSIAFAEADGEDLTLDACIPSDRAAGPFPAVVLIHGGAFQEGTRANMRTLCTQLATEGFAAFAIDYRLLPATYPAPIDDTVAAVEWLREAEQVDRFDIDPDGVSLLGSSAGGIIALSAAQRLGLAGSPPAAVVALSAGGDLTADALTLGNPDPALETVVLGYLGCGSVDDCAVATEASPVFNVTHLPPTLLVHGSEELIPIEQADALHAAIDAAGIPVTLDVVDGNRHGLRLLNAGTVDEMLAFLAANSSP